MQFVAFLRKNCYNLNKNLQKIDALAHADPQNLAIPIDGLLIPLVKETIETLHQVLEQYTSLIDEVKQLEKTKEEYYNDIEKLSLARAKKAELVYFDKHEEKKIMYSNLNRQKNLLKEQKKVEKLEGEYKIVQEDLQQRIADTNLAKSSYYYLTDAEIDLFENQRPKILAGIEKWGSISLALEHDKTITMRASSIMHYAQKHDQFKKDLEIAKQVFKDHLDAEVMERALNGTLNPVFQKGEYIGDYAIKDNKLLVEVAKANIPEKYNPKVHAAMNGPQYTGTTINILSFDKVDETKRGYTKNVGVVTDVDDTGRVKRITNKRADDEAKMLTFYEEKKTKNKDNGELVLDPDDPDIIEVKADGTTESK